MRTKKEILEAARVCLDAITYGGDKMNATMKIIEYNLKWVLEESE